MSRSYIFLLFALSLLCFSCGGSKKSTAKKTKKTGVHFVESNALMDILDSAREKDKIIFVDMYTTWCLPCKVMDEEVFSDKNLYDFMNKNFINYKVDAEKENGPSLVFHYNISTYPTLLFLDQKGNVLERKDGSTSQSELRNMANRALNKAAGL